MVASALRSRPQTARIARKERAVPPTSGGTKKLPASNVVHLDAARQSVKTWIDRSTTTGGPGIRGGDALKAYKRYAGRMAKDMTGAELRGILTEVLGRHAIAQKTSGYVIAELALTAAAAAPAKRRAAN